ncbi:MAG: tripartite tricarboxylate transporter substrate-binding protein [Proteobacteria bacterium]|nr:tripartite tricarboxylate transporter substrate-binding protein [Pseudomonadota bacterium]MDA0981647.1 tripartite tricarboxylate transporter substrate-binding protein [Pseudomonadota bacterium]
MNRILTSVAAGFVLALGAVGAAAQTFPTKPISLIVPWPAGGSTDIHLRAFAQVASKYVGQTIIVENKPGAGGMLGPANMAKTAKPDGYTLSQLAVSAFRIPHMQKVDWDHLKMLTQLDQVYWYKSSDDYARWGAETLKAERATIERVGLLLKQ